MADPLRWADGTWSRGICRTAGTREKDADNRTGRGQTRHCCYFGRGTSETDLTRSAVIQVSYRQEHIGILILAQSLLSIFILMIDLLQFE